MRRIAPLPLALVALGACADDTTVNPVRGPGLGFASGSRLKARVWTERGAFTGARLFAGWHDTRLDVDCVFGVAEDGAMRCAPTDAQIVIGFDDAACTEALALRDPTCAPPPAHASVTVHGDACEGVTRAFSIGARRDVPQKLYLTNGVTCTHVTAPSGVEAYEANPLDPGELVAARIDREATTPRLGLEVLVADDGARQARRIVDADRGPCFSIAGAVGGGADRCVPEAVAWATYAADAACKVPLAYQVKPSSTCPRADIVVAYAQDGCSVRTRFYAPGADVKIDDVYIGPPPVCTPVRAEPDLYKELAVDHVFYGVGDPLDDDALAPLGTAIVGDGRVAILALSDAAGTPLLPPRADTMYDRARGGPCRLVPFGDGTSRCVPADAVTLVTPAFADAACTREVAAVPRLPSCPDAPLPTVGLRAATNACTGEVYAKSAVSLGAKIALGAYYTQDAAGCASHAADGVYVEVTGDAPDLAGVAETVEP
jgi:hypothetical protein